MSEEFRMNLIKNIGLLLKHRDWTQAQLARRSFLSQKTISNVLIKPERTVALETLIAISAAFNISPWKLLLKDATLEDLLDPKIDLIFENYLHSKNQGKQALLQVSESFVDQQSDKHKLMFLQAAEPSKFYAGQY